MRLDTEKGRTMKALNEGEKRSRWRTAWQVAGDPVRLVWYLGRLLRDPRVPTGAKLKMAGAGIYAVVDGDLVADSVKLVPGLGYVDDLILVVHGIKCLISETEPAVAVELWPGDDASFKRTMTTVAWLDDQLYGRIRRGASRVLGKLMGGVTAQSS